jgi:hypothetical protein
MNAQQAPLPLGIPAAYPAELRWLLALPAWAQDQAQQAYANRLSMHTRIEPCHRCGRIILHALDDEYDGATTARADPTLIDPAVELEALLAGRRTYSLVIGPPSRLRHRDQWTIGNRKWPVLPQHNCQPTNGYPLPWEAIFTPPPKEITECPF